MSGLAEAQMKRGVTLLAACLTLASHCSWAEAPPEMTEGMAMPGMNSGDAQNVVPPERRSPPAEGYDFGPIPRPQFADQHRFGLLRVDRLEWLHADAGNGAAYDLQAWYGRDYDRAIVKAEGDIDRGMVQRGRAEMLWGHAVSPFWDSQVGVREDHGIGRGRGWLAVGAQGLAPYWFELNATAYFGQGGRTALRVEGEYELLLTQRLVLQPRVEMNFYSKSDPDRGLGAGWVDTAAGLRLRYEIRREFAPYLGAEWAAVSGGTAESARAAAAVIQETRLVGGVRFWF